MRISCKPIGFIRTPFTRPEGMPIQSATAAGARGRVELLPQFAEGLKDLDGFSHIILLYFFHRSAKAPLTVIPFLDSRPRGLFATRAPSRPNPIGLSVVELVAVDKNVLQVDHVDMFDGTPLLDIKPYVPRFDCWEAQRVGWLEGVAERTDDWKADGRFTR